MSKNKMIIISIVIIINIAFIHGYSNRITIDKNFILTTQNVQNRQLPLTLKINATVIPMGSDNAIAFGYLEISGQRSNFKRGFIYNSSNKLDADYCRLTCVTNETADATIDHYVNIKLKDNAVDELDLIEALTFHKSSRTESEVGTYKPL